MFKISYVTVVLAAIFLLSSGCARHSVNMRSLLGTNISDLQKARPDGKTKTVGLTRDKAFDKVLRVLREKGLTVYMSDRGKGYIVAIGLPEQTSTTRIGIFFETLDEDRTRITLSSLSSSALAKAEFMIFGSI